MPSSISSSMSCSTLVRIGAGVLADEGRALGAVAVGVGDSAAGLVASAAGLAASAAVLSNPTAASAKSADFMAGMFERREAITPGDSWGRDYSNQCTAATPGNQGW